MKHVAYFGLVGPVLFWSNRFPLFYGPITALDWNFPDLWSGGVRLGGLRKKPPQPQELLERVFDMQTVLRTPYRIDIKQPIYYVLESLDQLDEISSSDLMTEIHLAQTKGLNKPLHPVAKAS